VQGTLTADGHVTSPTLAELSHEFGCGYSTLRRKAYEERWIQQQEAWQLQLHQRIWEASIDDYVKAGRKFDAACIAVVQRAIDTVQRYFDEAEANDRNIGILDLDRLGRAALNWQKVGRLALGLSTENTASKVEAEVPNSSIDITLLTDDELKVMENLLQAVEQRQGTLPKDYDSNQDWKEI
jgi:hypothetical protein